MPPQKRRRGLGRPGEGDPDGPGARLAASGWRGSMAGGARGGALAVRLSLILMGLLCVLWLTGIGDPLPAGAGALEEPAAPQRGDVPRVERGGRP